MRQPVKISSCPYCGSNKVSPPVEVGTWSNFVCMDCRTVIPYDELQKAKKCFIEDCQEPTVDYIWVPWLDVTGRETKVLKLKEAYCVKHALGLPY